MTRAIHGFNWILRRREAVEEVPLKNQWAIAALVILLIVSAFSVIYLKDLSRRLFIRYQQLQHIQQQSEVEASKLLLEEGAWSTQARVQNLATTQLRMVMPVANRIVMIDTSSE